MLDTKMLARYWVCWLWMLIWCAGVNEAMADTPLETNRAANDPKAKMEVISQTLSELRQVHVQIAEELESRLIRVQMRLSPELSMCGEKVTLTIEALAEKAPNPTLELYTDYLANQMDQKSEITLKWRAAGARHGLTVYQAKHTFRQKEPGCYLLHWQCDIGGDVPEFWRSFAVITDEYAVCTFNSTSHRSTTPHEDFHAMHFPLDCWEQKALLLPNLIDDPRPDHWAYVTRDYRQYGDAPSPMLFTDYYLRNYPKEGSLYHDPDEIQQAVLSMYREVWPMLGFDGPMANFATYSLGNKTVQIARGQGFKTISALCAEQNWQDGSFQINHSGMPDRPYFISKEDFRKAGDGGPDGMVGMIQCHRNPVLCHDYDCLYSLEPCCLLLWNPMDGAGRMMADDLAMSRMYENFDAMVQNRLSHDAPYFFTVGIELNGFPIGLANDPKYGDPQITQSNRLLMEYAARKSGSEPLAFATGRGVTEFYRTHFKKTPETACYQHDYYCGVTRINDFRWGKYLSPDSTDENKIIKPEVLDSLKPAGFPDVMEMEGPEFKAIFKAPETLPYSYYDYQVKWEYPDWGNEGLPRNLRGYLAPGTYDLTKRVPAILDTRPFQIERTDEASEDSLVVRLTVQASAAQRSLALALWDLPRQWREGDGWWNVKGAARFVPVRAPFTGNLNGILVADVKEGTNTFVLKIHSPEQQPMATAFKLSDTLEGRVFHRDGQYFGYIWTTRPEGETLVVNPPAGEHVTACMAPDGDIQACPAGTATRFPLEPHGWMRLLGLDIGKIQQYCTAEFPASPAS